MRNALTSFEAEADRLAQFLDGSDAQEMLVATMLSGACAGAPDVSDTLDVIRNTSLITRRQNYVSSIIVLYGTLERFIEETVEECIDQLVRMYINPRELPEQLRKQHTRLSIDYLALLKDGKIRETTFCVRRGLTCRAVAIMFPLMASQRAKDRPISRQELLGLLTGESLWRRRFSASPTVMKRRSTASLVFMSLSQTETCIPET